MCSPTCFAQNFIHYTLLKTVSLAFPGLKGYTFSDPTRSMVVIRVKFVQAELMVEICFKSLVRAIGKVLLMKLRLIVERPFSKRALFQEIPQPEV